MSDEKQPLDIISIKDKDYSLAKDEARQTLGKQLVERAVQKLNIKNEELIENFVAQKILRKFALERHIELYKKELEELLHDIDRVANGEFTIERGYNGLVEIKIKKG